MKTVVFITAKVQIDVPDDLVAKVANKYFNHLAPKVYADILCTRLDRIVIRKQPIIKDPVDVALFSRQMTIDSPILLELAQNEIPDLKDLDSDKGELYEVDRMLPYSPADIARLTDKPVWLPTLNEGKALCPPIVNVHGRHYQATLLGPVSISNIMRKYKMFSPTEVFWDAGHGSGWDAFMQHAEMGGPFIKDIPVTFTSWRTKKRVKGTMMDLFLDRCMFDEKITEAIGVKYYVLPEDTEDKLQ